jgi:multidrug resistance efflux pump
MSERHDNNSAVGGAVDGSTSRPQINTLSDRVRSLRMPEPTRAARGGGSWFPWILCLLLAAAGGYVGYRFYTLQQVVDSEGYAQFKEKQEGALDARSGSSSASMLVAGAGEVSLESKGYIIPVHEIEVSPKVSGQILKLHFKEGDIVQKGFLLAEVEDINYRADYEHSLAMRDEAQRNLEVLTKYRQREVDQVKAKLEEAKALLVQMESDRQRSFRLRQTGALNDADFEKADSVCLSQKERVKQLEIDYELLKQGPRDINIKAAEARIKQVEADLVRLKWLLDNCRITAPVSGTILTKIGEEGNILNQLSFNLKGSLCNMANLEDIEVDLTIQERDVAKVFKGQHCRIRSEAFPDRIYEGEVSRLMPKADRAKGAVPVRVKVIVPPDEQGTYLKPEMGAIVSFFKPEDPNKKKNTKLDTKK